MGEIVFVSGTDTGVGKSVATAWLASMLAPARRVALVKAVQTGTTAPREDGDEAFYRSVLEERGLLQPVSTTTLIALPAPLAPSVAARRAEQTVDVAWLAAECRRIAREHDITLVEGAGGLLVPINDTADMAALAGALEAPLIVVTRPGLGTMNHTALTVEAAQHRGLPVELLICSGLARVPEVVEQANLRFFRERFPQIPLIALQRAGFEWPGALARLRPRIMGEAPPFLRGVLLLPLQIDDTIPG